MLDLTTAILPIQELFTQLLNNVDGYQHAWRAKAKFTGDTTKLTYGEVTATT